MDNQKYRLITEYDGIEYTLEFTANSIKKMERDGYNFTAIGKKMLTASEDIFCGLFIANHPGVPMATRRAIYKDMQAECDGTSLDEVLLKMFTQAVEECTTHQGNLSWRLES